MRETRVADVTELEPATLSRYSEFNDDLREAFLCAPPEALVKGHLADMLVVHEATRFLSRDARRKRRRLVAGSALGIGLLVAGGGAAAASGRLPDGLQDAVSSLAEPLGIDVPGGRSSDAPGHGGENPGRSEEAPGQQSQPGNSESAPGHGGENPGRSDTAPGHSDSDNNKPESPPGLSRADSSAPEAPGRSADPDTHGPGASNGREAPPSQANNALPTHAKDGPAQPPPKDAVERRPQQKPADE